MRSYLRRRVDARVPWRRPVLPLALALGYASLYYDHDMRLLRLAVEPTEQELDDLCDACSGEPFHAGVVEIPV